MKLHQLVRKNCNGSTYMVVDDVIGNFLEVMYNVLLIRGDNFKSLPKYLEVANLKFFNNMIGELENRD